MSAWMTTFGGEALFASGPFRFEFPGKALKVVAHDSPVSSARAYSALGSQPAEVVQTGRLAAADAGALHTLIDVVKAKVDGVARELVCGDGTIYPSMLMTALILKGAFEFGRVVSVEYEVSYAEAEG